MIDDDEIWDMAEEVAIDYDAFISTNDTDVFVNFEGQTLRLDSDYINKCLKDNPSEKLANYVRVVLDSMVEVNKELGNSH